MLSLLDERGMADLNGDNLQLGLNFPKEKIAPGQSNTRIKNLNEKVLMDRLVLVNEEILGPNIPEGAFVLSAQLMIDGSTGAGGIFDLGHKAGIDIDGNALAEDQDAFVQQADAGGQAVNKKDLAASKLSSILGKVGKGGLQTYAKCTESTTTTVATPRTLEWNIQYALEF